MVEQAIRMSRVTGVCIVKGLILVAAIASLSAQDVPQVRAEEAAAGASVGENDADPHAHSAAALDAMVPHQKHVGPHMKWTELRQWNNADAKRADQIVRALQDAIAKYRDYQVAMNDGFVLLHPERKAKHYHFANRERRFMAKIRFNPAAPTALLYKNTVSGYELEGAMYTAPRTLTEDQLNERIPLSIAQWHAHVNLCVAQDGTGRRLNRKAFGLKGTIVSQAECQQAGGRFVPQAGGWMIHVYPFESTPAKIWTH